MTANLIKVIGERDRLQSELNDCKGKLADAVEIIKEAGVLINYYDTDIEQEKFSLKIIEFLSSCNVVPVEPKEGE